MTRYGFVPFQKEIRALLEEVITYPALHGRWLNTLSYLENCGARKIAAAEDRTRIGEETLKHAAEEFRHAFYIKMQLSKIGVQYSDYSLKSLLGGWTSFHYLNRLDARIASYLRSVTDDSLERKRLSYLLTTYAVELRAGELYPLYHELLHLHGSPVRVLSIVKEEEEHLMEIESELSKYSSSIYYKAHVASIESELFEGLLHCCMEEAKNNSFKKIS